MKVTKAIREFIIEQIRIKADQNTHLEELRRKAEENKEEFRVALERLDDEYDKTAKAILNKYGVDTTNRKYGGSLSHYEHGISAVCEYNKARQEILEKRRAAELSIIAEMELGGSKAELMEKLNSLQF